MQKEAPVNGLLTKQSILEDSWLTTSDVTLKPKLGVLTSRKQAQIRPFIFSSPMDTVTGLEMTGAMLKQGEHPVVCRFIDEWYACLDIYCNDPEVFFAIGTKGQKLKAIQEKYENGQLTNPISLSIDIAHGDSISGHKTAVELSQLPYVGNIMSGTVCTPEGALRAIESGCNYIRVGVGPGSACTTRLMTGCGLPNLTAVYQIYRAIELNYGFDNDIKIIADGGIKTPGDAVKYLAAGAQAIMAGGIFSKCIESPGWKSDHTGQYKNYRGQASSQFQIDLLGKTPDCAEGAVGPEIRPEFECKEVIARFRGGLRSAISYLGFTSIEDLCPDSVTFIKVTSAGFHEGTPHGT
jgi:IMP dehydrogenase